MGTRSLRWEAMGHLEAEHCSVTSRVLQVQEVCGGETKGHLERTTVTITSCWGSQGYRILQLQSIRGVEANVHLQNTAGTDNS